jgi:beta-glucuronidase
MTLSLLYPKASASRRTVSLNGFWKFQFDPENKGASGGWTKHLPAPVFRPVPTSFTDKDSHEYIGDFWYKTESFIHEKWQDKEIGIRFASDTDWAAVFVNGKEIVLHEGGARLLLPLLAELSNLNAKIS